MHFGIHDWETTGLTMHPQAELSKQPRAIEFAGIITDGEGDIKQVEFICNPAQPVDAIITKITGLTNDDLACHPPFSHFAPQVREFFSDSDCALSHNLSFDRAILNTEARHLGKVLEDFGWPALEICSVEQTMAMFGRRMKLSELYEMRFGKYEQKHRAMDDLLLLHEVCKSFGIYEAVKRAQGV